VTLKMPAFEWVHVQLHQQKGMISLSPPTICNSAISRADDFAPVCPSKGLRSNGATFSMHVREPASFMARRSTPTFGRAA
ncbi:hypothetical protein, partial [Klebsiella pneumoniae]|uniref:hypothetical protein n=1 Tax=Klebsiella pneumoniae TaxID=573 RepID=UPI002117E7ED